MNLREALEKLARFNGQSGSCWDDPSNLVRLNDVRALIYERGDWEGTTDWICMNIPKGCFYLPIQYQKVISAYTCSSQINVSGRFSVVSYEYAKTAATGVATIIKTGRTNALFEDLSGAHQLSLSCESEHDVGKVVSVWPTGSPKASYELNLGRVAMSGSMIGIKSFSKPQTHGPVLIWSGNRLVAEWPSWMESGAHSEMRSTSEACQASMLVKKVFRKMSDLDEPIDIDSIVALTFGYHAFNVLDSATDDNMYASKVRLMENQLQKSDQSISIEETEPTPQVDYADYTRDTTTSRFRGRYL